VRRCIENNATASQFVASRPEHLRRDRAGQIRLNGDGLRQVTAAFAELFFVLRRWKRERQKRRPTSQLNSVQGIDLQLSRHTLSVRHLVPPE
jgi:hypothetical protein